MKKPIIGVIPSIMNDDSKIPFQGNFVILDYIQKLKDSGAEVIILGVANENDIISEQLLSLCDGFLFTGGFYYASYHLAAMEYAYQNSVPVLGICLGMQVIGAYSAKSYCPQNYLNYIKDINRSIVINHNPELYSEDEKKEAVHEVFLDKNSIINSLFGNIIKVNSRHIHCVKEIKPPFKVTGRSADGIIEVIEYEGDDKFILGVQWHPESMTAMNSLFDKFIDHTKIRMKRKDNVI